MTLNEALACADAATINQFDRPSEKSAITLAAKIRRLKSEVERLPARRAQPTVKTAPIGPTKHKKWGIIGIIDETDEEFAARSGWKVVEVAR